MKKLVFFIFICFVYVTTLEVNPSEIEENELENPDYKEDEDNKAVLQIPEIQNVSPNPITPSMNDQYTFNRNQVANKGRVSEVNSSEEEEESNEVHSKERRPSLVERLIHHKDKNDNSHEGKEPIPCTCGVFLSGQFKKGSKKGPKGLPVLTQEMDTPFMNNAVGNRQCTNKCLELIIKHLPKSSEIICTTVDREHVFKERAYLFIKNHSDKWHGTNLSAGREFCCKDNVPYKCPVVK